MGYSKYRSRIFVVIRLICLVAFASLALLSCKNKDAAKAITASSSSSDCPKYDRSDYSHWIDADGDCQDTRVEVLVAENIGTISYLTGSSCKVVTGSWYDPFTDTTFSTASRLDVDHMVPLKEAHESGAYLWSSTKKKEFATAPECACAWIWITAITTGCAFQWREKQAQLKTTQTAGLSG